MIHLKIIDLERDYKLSFGIPQANILSSFLFNIYMTPFDNFISDFFKKIDREGSQMDNFEYKKRTYFGLKKYESLDFRKRIKLLKIECDKAIAEGIFPYKEISEPTKIYYVRYADDILFGFNSSKEVAKKVISKSESFLKFDLHLSHLLIKLTHAKSDSVKFLGFCLSVIDGNSFTKARQLSSFQKVKVSLKRKRIAESEKYFKLVESLTSKLHRQFIDSVRLEGQTLIKRSQIKKVNDNKIK